MPAYQGELDGLCGQYAVTNALDLCGLGRHRQALFEAACASAKPERWPLVLWQGTEFSDLKRMVRNCLSSPANRLGIRARYPFYRGAPANNAAYWDAFDQAFSDGGAICAIVGLRKPNPHWVVVIPDGGRVAFIDSTPDQPVYRKNRASLYAGYRRPKPNQWLLDRRELVVLSLS